MVIENFDGNYDIDVAGLRYMINFLCVNFGQISLTISIPQRFENRWPPQGYTQHIPPYETIVKIPLL